MELMVIEKKRSILCMLVKKLKLKKRLPSVSNKKGLMLGTRKKGNHCVRATGAKYLAGSGIDISGTMPGISLHQGLELLIKIGLSERQALAAAASNFSEIFRGKDFKIIKV